MKLGTARRITANFLSLSIAEFISKLLQLLIFVYIARYFGKENFGIFSFGIAFATLVVFIADFGLSNLLIREISRNKNLASKYVSNALALKLVLSFVTIIVATLFLNLMGYSHQIKTVAYIMLSFTLLQTFTDLYYAVFRAFEKMYYDAFIKILRMFILVGLVWYGITYRLGIEATSLAFPLTELIILIITVLLVSLKFAKIGFEFDYIFSRDLLKKSSLFCLSLVFSSLFTYTDSIMLSKFRTAADVGIYAAASNLVLALVFIPLMYGNSIYPVISRFYIISKKSVKFAYEKSFKYILIIGLLIAVFTYTFSDKIILLFYGEDYKLSATVLSVFSFYLVLRFLNVISGFTLTSINRQGSRVFGQGTAALTNVTFNLVLIPVYGVIGAAYAALLTEVIFFFTYSGFILKYGIKIKYSGIIFKPLIAAVVTSVLLSFIDGIIIATIAGILAYSILLILLRIFDQDDKLILNKVLKNL